MKHLTSFGSGALIAAILVTGTAFADDSAQRLPAQTANIKQKPASSPATPAVKPAATLPSAGIPRAAKAPGAAKLSDEQLVEALKGVSISRTGKTRTIGVPPRVLRMLTAKDKASTVTPQRKPGKLVQINKTDVSPYAAVGLLANGCTGALIGKRFVLTAGYCIYDTEKQQFDQNLDFYPGINGDQQPFGAVKWKNAWAPTGFTKDKNQDFNWALIELDSNIGEQAGWFGFGYNNEFPFKSLNVAGYPGGKNMGVPDFSMWQTSCQLGKPAETWLNYVCPKSKAMGGFWGAPLWIGSDEKQDWTIFGVHIGTFEKGHWGVRMNQVNYETLIAWIDEAEKTAGGETETSETDTGGTDTGGTDTGGTDTGGTEDPDIGGTGTDTETDTAGTDTDGPDIGPACKCPE
jgi:V8-like Glu-specific endopeptidase